MSSYKSYGSCGFYSTSTGRNNGNPTLFRDNPRLPRDNPRLSSSNACLKDPIHLPDAWEYAKQACTRCKDINDPSRRQGMSAQTLNLGVGGPGLTYSSQYQLSYQPGTPGSVGEYYGILPPW